MGRQLADTLPGARRLYDQAAEILGYDLAQLCFEGPAEDLDSTVYSQPALFVTSLAALESLRASKPDVPLACEAVAGLSLGEYTALVFAGAMDFEVGLAVGPAARHRHAGSRRRDAQRHGQRPGARSGEVEQIVADARGGETLEIANLLCPGNIVVSGENDACQRAAELATRRGAMKVVPLAVAGAFHTAVMEPAVARLAAALADVPIRRPAIPVDFERRRPAARRSGGDPRAAGAAGRFAGPLGGIDALFARRRLRPVLRGRAGAGAARAVEADRSQGSLRRNASNSGVRRDRPERARRCGLTFAFP